MLKGLISRMREIRLFLWAGDSIEKVPILSHYSYVGEMTILKNHLSSSIDAVKSLCIVNRKGD